MPSRHPFLGFERDFLRVPAEMLGDEIADVIQKGQVRPQVDSETHFMAHFNG